MTVTHDFRCEGSIHAGGYVSVSSISVSVVVLCLLADCGRVCYRLWFVFMFSPVNAESLASLPFAGCVMLPWFHCEIGAVVLPLVWVAVCVQLPLGLLLSCFGHARAKKNSGLPCLA